MIYLDNSATTLPSPEVLKTFNTVASQYYGNPSSVHALGQQANHLLQQARQQVADLLAYEAGEIYFTSSGTESNNWVFQGILRAVAQARPQARQVILSAVEHPSISALIPYLEAHNYEVLVAPTDGDGILDMVAFQELLGPEVLLVSTMAVNNEVGSIQPFDPIEAALKAWPQILWHVDGVQAVTCQFDQLKRPRIDLLTLSGHKFHAVKGTGILAKRERVNAQPLLYGGGQEHHLRSSTENLPSIVATAKALRMTVDAQAESQERLTSFRQRMIEAFEAHSWQVFAKKCASAHILCVALPPIPGEVLVEAFGQAGIMVSTTSACSSQRDREHYTLKAMGVDPAISQSAIRISLSQSTQLADIQALEAAIQTVSHRFKK